MVIIKQAVKKKKSLNPQTISKDRSNTPVVKVDNVGHVRGSSIEDVKVSGEDNVVQTMREKRIMFIDVGESSVAEVGGSCGDKVVQKKGEKR
ncbi:hypothetical protein Tco_1077825, partial [Tanacetum coccineum]